MKKTAWLLMIVGVVCLGYYGFQYVKSTQAVAEYNPSIDNQGKEDIQSPADNESKKNEKASHEKNDANETTEESDTKKKMSDDVEGHNEGDEVATLKIPKLNKQFTTFWGTGEETLGQGVGMYVSEWTVTPEYDGNVVLSGHRDTVFTGLGDLDDGDVLELEYDGKQYEYEIEKTWITDPDDRSVIVDKEDPTLTLTTCYPFDYLGDAPERYIVQAKLK